MFNVGDGKFIVYKNMPLLISEIFELLFFCTECVKSINSFMKNVTGTQRGGPLKLSLYSPIQEDQ